MSVGFNDLLNELQLLDINALGHLVDLLLGDGFPSTDNPVLRESLEGLCQVLHNGQDWCVGDLIHIPLLDLRGLNDFLDNVQLWDLNCLFRDMRLWSMLDLHNKAINRPVFSLQLWSLCGLLNSLVNGDLSLRHDRGQCHGQTDRMDRNQIFPGGLGGFSIGDTGTLGGLARCITCCLSARYR